LQVRFISKSDAEAFFRPLEIGPGGLMPGSRAATRFKSDDLYYRSRLNTAREVSLTLADAQGDFIECAVWPFALAWGDRSLEERAPADWITYAQWRQQHGETRPLHEAPGHLFDANDRSELARLLELAIYMGWDTLVAARPTKVLVELSHDDRITIHARSRQMALIAKLERLGVMASRGRATESS
jgi:hypothetical protein